MKILITGANGFIGKKLVGSLRNKHQLVCQYRKENFEVNEYDSFFFDICRKSSWSNALQNVSAVIHLAAVAHNKFNDTVSMHETNVKGTVNLARQAAESGVKRFIFLSSIGVNGISNSSPFLVYDSPAPVENYAISKFEAEIGLLKIAAETGMEVVIIRPPLVYGPNAPGNFGKLANLARKNLPLPFGAIYNKRSLVSIDNLVDLIVTCIDHPKAANQTFLVSDDHDVSTTELLREMTLASGKKPRLLPVPMGWLNLAAKLTGKRAVIDRMCGSLQVDISHTKEVLGWEPPVSFKDGIQKCFSKE
ncbi:SDR family oxidoreductase [Marinomonas arenicola]|uniref:UDP-glucose 4-epimerase family protein n=2 Tax=Marinomonas arenicola TaxID=569601 RepID=UPI00311DA66F